MRFAKFECHRGFTFFEVIVVLVMISIFVVVAVAQHQATDPTLVVQGHVLRSHIRYTQMRAMDSSVVYGIHYNHSATPANRYYEIFADTPATTIALPGEAEKRVILGDMEITLNSTGDLTSPSAQSFWLSFDSWGQPYYSNGPQPAIVPLADNPARLVMTKPGHSDVPLEVTQRTGFIP